MVHQHSRLARQGICFRTFLAEGANMELGAFSISLAVKDLEASRAFYEKFAFKAFAGNAAQPWLILKNGAHAIGLFQGMFEKNILTFNPGWDSNASKLDTFTDVRDLQRKLKAQGVAYDRSRPDIHRTSQFFGNRPRRKPDSGRSAHLNPRGDHDEKNHTHVRLDFRRCFLTDDGGYGAVPGQDRF
jgi:hypothetical protein